MSADAGRTPSAVRKSMEPLAAWYRQNKPEVKRLVIDIDDYLRLSDATNATLIRNGFRRVGSSLWWNEFEVVRK